MTYGSVDADSVKKAHVVLINNVCFLIGSRKPPAKRVVQ